MRIVRMREFVNLPPGTIFSLFTPSASDGLYRLLQKFADDDFIYAPLIGVESLDAPRGTPQIEDLVEQAIADPTFEMPKAEAEGGTRWASYDSSDMFLVYSDQDVQQIVGYLQRSLGSTPPKTDLQRLMELHESFGIKPNVEQPTAPGEVITVAIDGMEQPGLTRDQSSGCPGYGAIYSFNADGSFANLWTGYL